VVDSRRFSKRLAAWVGLGALGLGACSTVRPQDKELLADPAMSYGSGGEAELQEEHVLSNREGAAGAGRATGGGCGCN
jgi:hypothetical protein